MKILDIKFLLFLAVLCFGACDEEHCADYTIRNNSGHSISLLEYNNSHISNESFELLDTVQSHQLKGNFCGYKAPAVPFSFGIGDSIFLYFDDTLKVVLFGTNVNMDNNIYGANTILEQSSWRKLKTTNNGTFHYFEYEFTVWHYQKALEANGYK